VTSLDDIRDGKNRPASAFYGEYVLPTSEVLTSVVKDAQGGTLVMVGVSSLEACRPLLENMNLSTVIVVDPSRRASEAALSLLDASSGGPSALALSPLVTPLALWAQPGTAARAATGGPIKNFSAKSLYAMNGAKALSVLFERIYTDFDLTKPTRTNTDSGSLRLLANRFNEFVN
jgi:hypothetical protein